MTRTNERTWALFFAVVVALLAAMLLFAGNAWAQSECPPEDPECGEPPPPPDNGNGNGNGNDNGNGNGGGGGGGGSGGGGGGGDGGGDRGGGAFIQFGAGYPFSGRTTVDLGAFPRTRFQPGGPCRRCFNTYPVDPVYPVDPIYPTDPVRVYSTIFPTDPVRGYSASFSARSFNTLPPNPIRRL